MWCVLNEKITLNNTLKYNEHNKTQCKKSLPKTRK